MRWAQDDLDKTLEVDDFTVYRWEAGQSIPPAAMPSEFQEHLGKRYALI